MLNFFTPSSKVQKDRTLIRDTDYRMAKYTRRGLLLTVVVFAVTLILGDFFKQSVNLSIGLAAALVLLTIARGYVMFGFDAIYPRAPARWRNLFFVFSILGVTWWGVIVACYVRVLGFSSDTHFLWLYTIVFYSGMCAVMAPYRLFLSWYLFLGLLPMFLAAVTLGTLDGFMYAGILILLFIMLRAQGNMMSALYWERLEANYSLKQRADSLEMEKRDSQAAAQLNHEFLVSLSDEFRSTLNDIVGALSVLSHDRNVTDKQRQLLSLAEKAGERQLQMVNSVIDYSKIKAHKLLLDETVFNLPRLIEECFNEKEIEAEIHGKEFSLNFSENIPSRVKGDSIRTSQLINNLIDQSISYSRGGDLDVRVRCEPDGDDTLKLELDIIDNSDRVSNPAKNVHTGAKISTFTMSMCKHLALAMGGDFGFAEEELSTYWLELPLAPLSSQSFLKQYESKFHNEYVLVVDSPKKIEQELLEIFTQWGLKVVFASGTTPLEDAVKTHLDHQRNFHLVLIFSKKDSLTAIAMSEKLDADETLKHLPHVVVVSHLQAESRILGNYRDKRENLQIIQKPVTQDKLYQAFTQVLLQSEEQEAQTNSRILLIEDNAVDQLVVGNLLDKLGYQYDVTASEESGLKRLQQKDYDLVFLTCHLNGCEDCRDSFSLVDKIRDLNNSEGKRTPVLGLTMLKNDQQDRSCLTHGLDDTIAKPIRKEELKKQLDHWLVTQVSTN